MLEISKQFRFDAAHTLERKVETAASRRIHGHSYRAEVVVRGTRDMQTGMVMDFGVLHRAMEDVRLRLDHHFLNEVPNLQPATMENIAVWIWQEIGPACPGLHRVTVYRDSTGEACSYFGEHNEVAE